MISSPAEISKLASSLRLLITDVDGVLTDSGVYYDKDGEVMKRFSIRDGMGVERLQNIGIAVGIITGEKSESVVMRARKLNIDMVHLFCKDKASIVQQIMKENNYRPQEIAYIGDDVNDIDAMQIVGLSAAPADAFIAARKVATYVCRLRGGHGAFREFAELIIDARNVENQSRDSFGFM